MKGLVLNLNVSPDFQGQGYGLSLGKRVATLIKQRGATSAIGLILDDSTADYVESLGFVLRDNQLRKGFCDIPNLNNIPNQDVPNTVDEVLRELDVPVMAFEWETENDNTVLTTLLAWYEKNSGRAVAKARFKVF